MRKYEEIYALVRQIPPGKVATYGQIAALVGGCTARMVGYAMAATPEGSGVPWQRVINSKGKISPHGFGYGSALQRALLEGEGVVFDEQGSINLKRFGWLTSSG
ncbi:MAG: cysteine methyltransferase [Anaerolineae bacterium]|nr:cysteine methyltransferase [Anaerolineae bacterium]